ncbi:hypothetical protein ILYODFUR_018179 [Ilyodon furcidens]|uniref:Uncharacterized protein n=1 Tax=Ilyodon furcidens TaxID=33524 RepID=A0ABV0SMA1_9TELE
MNRVHHTARHRQRSTPRHTSKLGEWPQFGRLLSDSTLPHQQEFLISSQKVMEKFKARSFKDLGEHCSTQNGKMEGAPHNYKLAEARLSI